MADRRPYVGESHDRLQLAPAFDAKVTRVLEAMHTRGHDAYVFETVRVQQRQWWIYGCGRTVAECLAAGVPAEYAWPDGRKVTNAASHVVSVHGHGLAVDIISKAKRWAASVAFTRDLGACARAEGLTWGGAWKSPVDWPHLQWPLRRSGILYAGPSLADRTRTLTHGMRATWTVYGADRQPQPQAPERQAA